MVPQSNPTVSTLYQALAHAPHFPFSTPKRGSDERRVHCEGRAGAREVKCTDWAEAAGRTAGVRGRGGCRAGAAAERRPGLSCGVTVGGILGGEWFGRMARGGSGEGGDPERPARARGLCCPGRAWANSHLPGGGETVVTKGFLPE